MGLYNKKQRTAIVQNRNYHKITEKFYALTIFSYKAYNEKHNRQKEKTFMDKKLLFFDIDGTLITENTGELPKSTVKAVKMAKEKGHLLFINTGRTKASMPKEILNLEFDGYVCGCGTNIFFRGQEILSARLTSKLCKEVVKKVREYKVPVFYEASDAIYFDRTMPDLDGWVKQAEETFRIQARDVEEILGNDSKVYDKLLLILEPTERNEELKAYLSAEFTCIDRMNNMFEIIQKDYTKATGIEFVCKYLGKSLDDCYVFGDSENDRTMLEAVKNSIAMGNASQAIKESCSYVTTDIQNDGIYEAMKHFGLI